VAEKVNKKYAKRRKEERKKALKEREISRPLAVKIQVVYAYYFGTCEALRGIFSPLRDLFFRQKDRGAHRRSLTSFLTQQIVTPEIHSGLSPHPDIQGCMV
jgi:hypothetical protein